MKFLNCSILFRGISSQFSSAYEAIGFIESDLDETEPFSASVTVECKEGQATFWFGNQEATLQTLMDL